MVNTSEECTNKEFSRRHHSSAIDIFLLQAIHRQRQLARMQCLRTTRIPMTLSRARVIPKLYKYRLAAMSTTTGNDPLTAGLSAVPVQPEDKSAASLRFADVGSQAQAFESIQPMLSGCRLAST